jgi:TonB-linked SusC/RagA family outer membrane protein
MNEKQKIIKRGKFLPDIDIRKIPNRMKPALLFLAVILSFTAGATNRKVSISMKNAKVEQALKAITRQTGLGMAYSRQVVDLDRRITVNVNDADVTNVLDKITEGTNLGYEITEDKVYLFEKSQPVAVAVKQNGQEKRNVTGTVKDIGGAPIIGGNVVEKGTTNGSITGIDGTFTLQVATGATLIISYIGYVTREIAVGNQSSLDIILEEDNLLLDEVVVVGYGTVQRKNFTGSVSTVNVANSPIALSPRTNAMDMLRGTVTGATVSRESDAGGSPSIEVHGQKSIRSSSSNPLVVLDGVVYMGGWRDIDPATIESMSLLKDATSLAAYGSQAANGVLMITTKKGKIGKPIISFDGSLAVANKAMTSKVVRPDIWIEKKNISRGVTDGNPQAWMQATTYANYQAGKITDWWDYTTQTGITQNYSVSVSGATEHLNYYTSLSHTDQKGIVIGDQYKRDAITARMQHDITDWLQVGAQVNYSYNNYDGVRAGMESGMSELCVYAQPSRPNGMPERMVGDIQDWAMNPLWKTSATGYIDDYDRYSTTLLKGHALIKVPWITGLSYRFNVAYSEENFKRDQFTHENYYCADGFGGEERYTEEMAAKFLSNTNGSNQRRLVTYYVLDNILNYTNQFGKHFVDATAVYTRDQNVSNTRSMNGSNFSAIGNTILGYNGLAFAGVQTVGNSIVRKANIGYLGRVQYNFDNRYHLTASIRRDGSSVFGAEKKWGVFPAVGTAWTVTNENFMQSIDLVSLLKLKASWGKNGNQSLNPYGTLSTINLGRSGGHGYVFDNSNISWAQFVSAIGNPELGWETTTAVNAGFEIGVLNDRIQLEWNTYKSQTTDQIFSRTIPVMTNGFTSTQATMGQVDNWGIEFTLNTVNIKNRDMEWSSMLNFYINRNKLVDLYGDGKDDKGSSLFLGKSLGAIYTYKIIGMVQEDDIEYITANNSVPGNPKFANINGSADGKITMSNNDEEDDRTIVGYNKENFRMNMAQTFIYKNWELYALFTGIFSGGGYGMATNSGAYTNIAGFVDEENLWWTPENKSNTYPRINFTGGNYNPLMPYGFVRLQDLNLSYAVRPATLQKLGIQRLRIYVSGKNIFTITKWKGGDPENRLQYSTVLRDNIYPLQRTFSLGVQLSF